MNVEVIISNGPPSIIFPSHKTMCDNGDTYDTCGSTTSGSTCGSTTGGFTLVSVNTYCS